MLTKIILKQQQNNCLERKNVVSVWARRDLQNISLLTSRTGKDSLLDISNETIFKGLEILSLIRVLNTLQPLVPLNDCLQFRKFKYLMIKKYFKGLLKYNYQ